MQRPNTEYLGAKDAYDYQINKLQKIDADANSIFDSFLAEKALNINRVRFIIFNSHYRLKKFSIKEMTVH